VKKRGKSTNSFLIKEQCETQSRLQTNILVPSPEGFESMAKNAESKDREKVDLSQKD
jgi:hypothetical protein